jgi:hypothetical protein
MEMKRLLALVMVLGFVQLAQSTEDAGGAARYLRMGVGARALSMGGAFVGLADDSTAAYWNPAGLVQLEKRELSAMYSVLSLDRRYNFVSFASPVSEDSTLALSIINFGVDELREFVEKNGNPKELGLFTDSENTALLSFAKAFRKVALGCSLKALYQSMDPSKGAKSAVGWGIDVGVLTNPAKSWYFGLVLQDAGSYLKWDTGHTDRLPIDVRAGVSCRLLKERLNICCDIEKIEARDNVKVHLGAEYWIGDIFAVRGGLNSTNPTAGCSLVLSLSDIDLGLHYAFSRDTFTAFDEVGDYNHRISLSLRF